MEASKSEPAQPATAGYVTCPSCGRHIGPVDICPYCQASVTQRLSLVWVRRIAVIGAVLGIILIWIGVRLREIPKVNIGEITVQYNMAIVRLEGTVTDVQVKEDKDSFNITLDDGTGHARLSGYGKLAMFRRILKDKFPREGDRISAVGNLSVSETWGITLFLSTPRRLKLLQRGGERKIALRDLSMDMVGTVGWFSGEIVEDHPFSKGHSLALSDGSASVRLTIFRWELAKLPEHVSQVITRVGTRISFFGKVDVYRSKLQLRLLHPEAPGHVVVLEASPETPPGE